MRQKLLVVDDEANIRLSLGFLLGEAGYDVQLAENGDAALAAIEAEKPDLVLLDVMMPGQDGYDICQKIRANPKLDGTPVIMLSAKSRQIEREKGLAMGASAYIAKPFSIDELLAKLKEQLSAA